MKRELTQQELQELHHLEYLQKRTDRYMCQIEFDRLKYLCKLQFTGCDENCNLPEGWRPGGYCDINGCYFSPSTAPG